PPPLLPLPLTHSAPPTFPTRRSSDLSRSPKPTHSREGSHRSPKPPRSREGSYRSPEPSDFRCARDGHQLSSRGVRRCVRANRTGDRKSTRLNSSHRTISYAVFCLKKN